MANHQQILIDAVNKAIEGGMTAKQIAAAAGIDNSVLSRFVNGKQDIKAGDYFSILNVLPDDCRVAALTRLGVGEISVTQLVQSASPKEKAEILQAMAAWVLQPGAIPVGNTDTASMQVAV
ncbi:helix-turn-helix transcriptional regulator [Nostoc sp. CENA67]|uniref:Helix-turn-helix transcriptional regulator n=1 Tax=Amazonocrinis nigriterrae CENA67 TaxID=2794033 RepID=A0A8J7HXW8_9NOST|nr:helix-turn-helix transcriptional regulator [Amazonocrinis nigriterrae]MBH8564449.1 helix-turn-helix transcriptional regulator [Amazonocrinis nigriterrae CENA67]